MLYLCKVDQIKKIENVFGNLSRISICLQRNTTILYNLACLASILAQEQPRNKLDSWYYRTGLKCIGRAVWELCIKHLLAFWLTQTNAIYLLLNWPLSLHNIWSKAHRRRKVKVPCIWTSKLSMIRNWQILMGYFLTTLRWKFTTFVNIKVPKENGLCKQMGTLPHTGKLKDLFGINHYSIIINHYSFWARQGGYELPYNVCDLWDALGDILPHAVSPQWSRSARNLMLSLQDFSCTGDRVALGTYM